VIARNSAIICPSLFRDFLVSGERQDCVAFSELDTYHVVRLGALIRLTGEVEICRDEEEEPEKER